jgi:hypothetical protein
VNSAFVLQEVKNISFREPLSIQEEDDLTYRDPRTVGNEWVVDGMK